jgi:hypothetical protein
MKVQFRRSREIELQNRKHLRKCAPGFGFAPDMGVLQEAFDRPSCVGRFFRKRLLQFLSKVYSGHSRRDLATPPELRSTFAKSALEVGAKGFSCYALAFGVSSALPCEPAVGAVHRVIACFPGGGKKHGYSSGFGGNIGFDALGQG